MHAVFQPPGALRARWRVLLALAVALGAMLTLSAVAAGTAAASAAAPPQALILGDSVTPGVAPDGSGESLEEYEAKLDGFATTVVDGATWDSMSAAQFAAYQVLIIGDPTCGGSGAYSAAQANQTTWQPVVMSSGGNKVLIGTDPVFHYRFSGVPGDKLIGNGIAFAGNVGGATGVYVDLTCGYDSASPGTPVPLMDGLSTHGPGGFTAAGEGFYGACGTTVNIVASSGPTSGLTDADLSNWSCSVHEAFDSFPSDWTPMVLAPSSSGFPSSYCANDVETGALACGSPYVLISGGGVVVTSNVTLNPPTQTKSAGGSATLTAHVQLSDGTPVSGATVDFSVDTGPNAGYTASGSTDSNGDVQFNYNDSGGAGTDNVSATYTDSHGVTQKGLASVTWNASTGAGCRMTGNGRFRSTGKTFSIENALSSDTTKSEKLIVNANGHRYVLTRLDTVRCIDDPKLDPGQGQTYDTFTGDGVVTRDGVAGFSIHFEIKDGGESPSGSGVGLDLIRFRIADSAGKTAVRTHEPFTRGNEDAQDGS